MLLIDRNEGKKGMIYNGVLCDAEQQNCAIYYSMQCCVSSPKNDAIMEVISDILNEPIFDTLRTKQQLGVCTSLYPSYFIDDNINNTN